MDSLGRQRVKGNLTITKATQLLTQKQKREKRLKKVNPNHLLLIIDQLKTGISLEQYRKKANINKSTFHRQRKDLEMFGVFENTLEIEKEINVLIDFKDYYWHTDTDRFHRSFFDKEKKFRYG